MSATGGTTIVWLRRDLRLSDHEPLAAAARAGAVVPLYVWSPQEESPWAPGAASRWWLDGSLRALEASLREHGSRLVVRRGPALDVLRSVAAESGAARVFWSDCHEPAAIARDATVRASLRRDGLDVRSFESALLAVPSASVKDDGTPYRVFTPFWKAMLRRGAVREPVPAPSSLPAPAVWPSGLAIDDLDLRPAFDWAGGLRATWTPGEAGARERFDAFVGGAIARYPVARNEPGKDATSHLSPHLHFGEIGVRELWKTVRETVAERGDAAFDDAAEAWLRQIAWREFAHHLLVHYPHTTDQPLRPEFARFAWSDDAGALEAWQQGRTGYPFVDAGMRQLWATGWMHNRVRMVVASFLVKHLRTSWQQGSRWFWDTLVDADLACNTLGWQWTAGCGADAAPYFRVFNPTVQSRRFDSGGTYLRRWLPELAALDRRWIHEPASAPPLVLASAGVRLGSTYPEPIVAHDAARRLALEAYDDLVQSGKSGTGTVFK